MHGGAGPTAKCERPVDRRHLRREEKARTQTTQRAWSHSGDDLPSPNQPGKHLMSTALTTTISEDARMRLMLAIAIPSGESKGLVEIAKELDVSATDLVTLLNDASFLKGIKALTMAQANLSFHTDGIKGLAEIAIKGEERNRLSAIRTLAQITGNLKNSHQVDVRVTFDDLRKKESNDPLSKLFDIPVNNFVEGELADE